MNVISLDASTRRQIKKALEYANSNIYQSDDLLDIMNSQMIIPGDRPEHLVRAPMGQWICYYIVDHPNKGLCHYFQITPDASGKLPDKQTMDDIVHEFGIESRLLDKHITIENTQSEVKIILPFSH